MVARALTVSPTVYLLVNAAHIMAIGALFGAILSLDLRILGMFATVPLQSLALFLSRIAASGAVLAVLTGLCLFSVRPQEYAQNPAFLAKVSLVAFGVAHALAVHRTAGWRAILAGGTAPAPLRFSALLSSLIWISAIVAGRWIGFL
ncbi:DUF6644 family protein [Pseudorhizobium tarimense]|nr:DUF6644 family protein [Pseudorhizobium tarimense]MCJ8517444.1 DUF2214 domain-containing protein [Pseudorhizobium tarimense]